MLGTIRGSSMIRGFTRRGVTRAGPLAIRAAITIPGGVTRGTDSDLAIHGTMDTTTAIETATGMDIGTAAATIPIRGATSTEATAETTMPMGAATAMPILKTTVYVAAETPAHKAIRKITSRKHADGTKRRIIAWDAADTTAEPTGAILKIALPITTATSVIEHIGIEIAEEADIVPKAARNAIIATIAPEAPIVAQTKEEILNKTGAE